MKKVYILIVLAELCVIPVFAQHPPQDKNWETQFQDDFNYQFDENYNSLWFKSYGAHNAGKENEGKVFSTYENVYTDNGKLVLQVQHKNSPLCQPQTGSCVYGGVHSYTSGSIGSCSDYHYGYYEIYAKLPASDGYFPAFWLWKDSDTATSNCWYNEIDIFEKPGCQTNCVHANVHWDFDCPPKNENSRFEELVTPDHGSFYYWYALEWDRDKITWYINHKTVKQETNDMEGVGIQNALRIVLNVALYPIDSTKDCQITEGVTLFPNYMRIKEANAYQLDCDNKTVVNDLYETVNVANFSGVKKSITLSDRTVIPITGTTPSKANDQGGSSEASLNPQHALRATDFIELKPGFEVRVGANLYLDINPCENTTP